LTDPGAEAAQWASRTTPPLPTGYRRRPDPEPRRPGNAVKDVRDINQLRPLTLTSQHHATAKLGLPRLHYGVESSPAWTSVVSASRFKMRPR